MSITIFFDGSCANNPMGAIGYGCYINNTHSKEIIELFGGDPPNYENSNNVAEYRGLLLGLEYLLDNAINNTKVYVFGDSQMAIYQLSGKYKIGKKGRYVDDAIKAKTLVGLLQRSSKIDFEFRWVPREENVKADELSNKYYNT